MQINKFTSAILIKICTLMKILSNPWTKYKDYDCFGCSPNNPLGLKMIFTEEEDYLYCEWQPELLYQGYTNVLHGGVIATLMDEIASWTVFVKADKGAVTSKMEIKYRKPVLISEGKIKLRSKLLQVNKWIARIRVELFNNNDKLCAEAVIDYYIMTTGKSEEGFVFPGREAFYENNQHSVRDNPS